MKRNQKLPPEKSCTVAVILFDFGGVLAEEGFRNGLGVIAGNNGLDQELFVKTGFDLIHKVGYLLGQAAESDYWRDTLPLQNAAVDVETHRKVETGPYSYRHLERSDQLAG